MKKHIELMGRQLEYELQRKKVKNINLRIKPEGVYVSANRLVPQYVIDSFLRDRADFIFSAMERLSQRVKPKYENGSIVPLLGREYSLSVCKAGKTSIELTEDSIRLGLKDTGSDSAKKALDGLYRKTAEKLIPDICKALCIRMGRQLPQIKYRAMKSRWGSCTPAKGQICINSRLVTAPVACVEFVVAHELCHFLQANHSPAFYAELADIIPDW
ncbi:MAG: M48 family metallopeptidase [Oscillospiraceae bacterium]|nr:M48 family metallopeptidase [Oscillospiraceae bacterium]